MKILIADKVYDANDVSIIAILSEEDKGNIAQMAEEATVYGCFPGGTSEDERDKACIEAKKHSYKEDRPGTSTA